MDTPNIVLIGGGSGSAALFPELIHATPHVVTVVSMSDDGGSTGELSTQLGVPPVGDLRNIMLAASDNPAIRAMRMHRFGGKGHLHGHTWGNMTLAACIDKYGLQAGVRQASQILQVPGLVLPVTLDRHTLMMRDGSKLIRGEDKIGDYEVTTKQPSIWLEPSTTINPEAKRVIDRADLIVIAPGSVYTSLLPALSVEGLRDALAANRAPKVLTVNLATELHHTSGWHVVDYVKSLRDRHIPIDYALYNTQTPPVDKLEKYLLKGQQIVDYNPDRFGEIPEVICIGAQLLAGEIASHDPSDTLERSYIRHNASEVRRQLWKILANQ